MVAPGVRTIKLNSDVLSPLYNSCFDHTYHSAILLMSKSAVHSYKYDTNHQISPTRVPVRLPRDIIPPPLSPLLHLPRPAARQQEPGSYPTPTIRPDEEDDGQLRTGNSASKSMEPRKWPELLSVLFFFTNCFANFRGSSVYGKTRSMIITRSP